MRLLIGNKNYSSWSLRSWLLLRGLEIPFEEDKLSFNDPDFKARVAEVSPAGRVPVLVDGDRSVWDTLAIAEYLAERFPEVAVWPRDADARAYARAVCAEMHSGFAHLRAAMPMNIEARLPGLGWSLAVQGDVDRIVEIWTDARRRFGAGGDFLFGVFGAADAFFAPVVWRFITHEVATTPVAEVYMKAVLALPAMRAWEAEALVEGDYVAADEPYRAAPGGPGSTG